MPKVEGKKSELTKILKTVGDFYVISGYTGNVRKLTLGMMRGWVLYGFCGMVHPNWEISA